MDVSRGDSDKSGSAQYNTTQERRLLSCDPVRNTDRPCRYRELLEIVSPRRIQLWEGEGPRYVDSLLEEENLLLISNMSSPTPHFNGRAHDRGRGGTCGSSTRSNAQC